MEKQVSWVYTLQYLLERLGIVQTNVRTSRGWESKADHDVESGITTQYNSKEDSKNLVKQIYQKLPWIDTLDIVPIQNYKDGPRKSDTYKFGDQMKFYTIKGNHIVTGKARDNILNQINWGLTLNEILQVLYSYDQLLFDVLKDRTIDIKNTHPKEYKRMKQKRADIGSVLREFNVKSATDVDEFGMGLAKAFSKIKLKGRGLIGAGYQHGLRGYSNTSKTLRAIKGSGTASDLKYKQIGSKFIRVPDLRLDQPRLKLVYANRTQVGKMIDISKPLAKVLEILAFKQDIEQQIYNKLSVSDKQVVHDVLRLCHLDSTFLNPPENPLLQLKAEFDKLLSQVMLGNDNPDNLRELKTLSLDLYNNKLINDNEMREILSL